MLNNIKLISHPALPATYALEVDGQEYHTAHVVRFEAKADHFATAEIGFLSERFEYDGKAVVTVTPELAELLVKLGWTAPAA